MQKTLLILFIFTICVYQINSQALTCEFVIPSANRPVSIEDRLIGKEIYGNGIAMKHPEKKPKISLLLKTGIGQSKMHDTKTGNPTIKKSSWGFSSNFGIGCRIKLFKRGDLECDFGTSTMKSKVEGVQYTTMWISAAITDTISVSNGSINTDWLNLQFGVKFRFQPKRSLPLFLNVGFDLKKRKANHSTWSQTVTQIGRLVQVQLHELKYERLPSPTTEKRNNIYSFKSIDKGMTLSLELVPFVNWSEKLSIEAGLNEGLPDYDWLGLKQRFVFLSLKYIYY